MGKVPQMDKQGIYDRFGDGIVDPAPRRASDLEALVLLCRILAGEGHSDNLAGQVTIRRDGRTWLTLCIGPLFGEVTAEDVCVVDEELNPVEGTGAVNPALRFHNVAVSGQAARAMRDPHTPAVHLGAVDDRPTPGRIAHGHGDVSRRLRVSPRVAGRAVLR